MYTHPLPEPIKGATHVQLTEFVAALEKRAIIVRGTLGSVSEDGFVADPDLTPRAVFLTDEPAGSYTNVLTRAAGRGLAEGDFGREDILAEVDSIGW
jgi:hypothetical protein